MLTPISAGTTEIESDAKTVPLFNAMKIYATTTVDGIVPMIPPVLVPYFSAIIVIRITTAAERINGIIACNGRLSICERGYNKPIKYLHNNSITM